jgi:hypothetical protein
MDTMGWSFCIVAAPDNEVILSKCIQSIQKEFSNETRFEILVVGTGALKDQLQFKSVKFLEFNEEVFAPDLRNIRRAIRDRSMRRIFYKTGAICQKKNLAVKHAKFDKICLMHDYVGLEPGWKAGFAEFGANWEVCVNQIKDIDGRRHRDWMSWDYPNVGPGLLPYHAYTEYMYISGTYFCVKRDFFLLNPLNERLFWGEGEDVEWSLRVRGKTRFAMNKSSIVKYLKPKPKGDCPNCPSWEESTKKLKEIFAEGTEE